MRLVEDGKDRQRTNIVRFAALGQKAFPSLQPEYCLRKSHPTPLLISLSNCIIAKGYLAGYVHQLGRTYEQIAASPGHRVPIYQNEDDDARLRAFVEDYTTRLLKSSRLALSTCKLFEGRSFIDQTRGWAVREDIENADSAFVRACCIAAKRAELPGLQTGELVQFFGTDYNVGFASSAACIQAGDRIIAFRGCHVGFIVRPLPGSSYLQIISKADVETALQGDHARLNYDPMEDPECQKFYVLMDFRTLQQLTEGAGF